MARFNDHDKHDPTPLGSFEEYNTYQGFYKIAFDQFKARQSKIAPASSGMDYVFNLCILYVTDWLKSRISFNRGYDEEEVRFLNDYPAAASEAAGGFNIFSGKKKIFDRAKRQFDISILALEEFGEWTLRIREPNNNVQNSFVDMLFTTDVAVKKTEEFVYLTVRTRCKQSHSHSDKAAIFRPLFLTNVFSNDLFKVTEGHLDSQFHQIEMKKTDAFKRMHKKNDGMELAKLILDPGRQQPVVFCPPCGNLSPEVNEFKIGKLGEHLAGQAYVIADDFNDGFAGVFSLDVMRDAFSKYSLTDAKEKITGNYLILNPLSDVLKMNAFEFVWVPVDDSLKPFKTVEEEGCEKTIYAEIKRAKQPVFDYFLNRTELGLEHDIYYGDVLFYSDLWTGYIEMKASKVDEEIRELEQLEIQSDEAGDEETVEELKKHNEELREEVKKLKKTLKDAYAEYREDIAAVNQGANKQWEEEKASYKKTIAELEEKYRKRYDYRVENEMLEFIIKFMSVPYAPGKLIQWVEDNMKDYIVVIPKAKETYKSLRSADEDKVRNGFILMCAYIDKKRKIISDEVYDKINGYEGFSDIHADDCGGDSQKCLAAYGYKADFHITYGEHKDDMFRIYLDPIKDPDPNGPMYKLIAVDFHVV